MSLKNNGSRIAKNTLFLYGHMFLSMLIGLYTSRVILKVLGINDFGIYNVVGGVVAMFGVLNSAMSSSTSRFLTIELGHKNLEKVRAIFNTSLFIHVLVGVFLIAVAEPIGLWFVKNKMNILEGRFDATLWVFHATVLSTFMSIVSVPYLAVLIAREKMNVFAYVSTIDIVLRLGAVLMLPLLPFDKLIAYSILILIIQLIIQLIYWVYCQSNFLEVKGKFKIDKPLFKEMSLFAGWSLFGDSAVLMMTQGTNILLNIFFGAALNASRGIAVQVQGVLLRFIGSFQTALNPQLIKSYAQRDLEYMHKLIFTSTKYSFCLFLIIALPVFLDTRQVLIWWLNVVPDHTVNFVRLLLLVSLIECLSNPLVISAKATGNIRNYQLILGSGLLLVVPVSYLFLKRGYPPEVVFMVHLALVCLGQFLRVMLIRPMINLSVKKYVRGVIVPCMVILIAVPLFPYIVFQHMSDTIVRFIVVIFVSAISMTSFLCLFIMSKYEKQLLLSKISYSWISRFNRNQSIRK